LEIFMRALLASSLLFASSAALAEVKVEDPWIAEAPPGAAVLAGYMQLHNHSAHDQALVGATSPAFAQVELHRSVEQDGVARMARQEQVEVPAHGSLTLQPGGYHFMLMQPSKPLKAGDRVPLSLQFGSGERVELEVPVRKKMMGGHHHKH
jgi:copper(I)-binding protein